MRWFTHMSIVQRLVLSSLLVALVPGLIIASLGMCYLQFLAMHGRAVKDSTDTVQFATSQLANLQTMNADFVSWRAMYSFQAHDGDDNQIDSHLLALMNDTQIDLTALRIRFVENCHQYQSHSPSMHVFKPTFFNDLLAFFPDRTSIAKQYQLTALIRTHLWPAYAHDQDLFFRSFSSSQSSHASIEQSLDTVLTDYIPLERSWSQLVALAEHVSATVIRVDSTQYARLLLLTALALVAMICFVCIIGLLVKRTILQPLSSLVALTSRISKGHIDIRAPISGHDEITLVARSINTMLDQITSHILQTRNQHSEMQTNISHLAQDISGVSHGDLRRRARSIPDTLRILPESFNYMLEAFGDLILLIQSSANEVDSSATVTSHIMHALTHTSSQQFTEITAVSHAIHKLAISSDQAVAGSKALSLVSHLAQDRVQRGRLIVSSTIASMQQINVTMQHTSHDIQLLDQYARQIDYIISAIDTIAQQVDSLAQQAISYTSTDNPHTWSFGFVAKDILQLSERVKDQAQSIKQIALSLHEDIYTVVASICHSVQESERSVDAIQCVEHALETLFATVEQQIDMMALVQHNIQQGRQYCSVAMQSMHTISSITKSQHLTTQNIEYNAHNLSYQVSWLRTSVDAFKVRDTPQRVTTHRASSYHPM